MRPRASLLLPPRMRSNAMRSIAPDLENLETPCEHARFAENGKSPRGWMREDVEGRVGED
eukprot:8267228-Pyramimonas_sp.AAC.2